MAVDEGYEFEGLFRAGMFFPPSFVRPAGWISPQSPFPTGEVPARVVHRLAQFAASAGISRWCRNIGPPDPSAVACEWCDPPLPSAPSRRGNRFEPSFGIPFANLLFVSPTLITHYITAHGYRPCDEYLAAVDAAPLPGSQAFADLADDFRFREDFDGPIWTRRTVGPNWFEKGMCPTCGNWIYSYDQTVPIVAHCGCRLVQCSRNPHFDRGPSGVVVLMGVNGSGKTTVGRRLAVRCCWPFLEADDLHAVANIAKMRRGEPLTDADREPWLDAVHQKLFFGSGLGRGAGVLACPALKASYRQRLVEGIAGVTFVYLRADRGLLSARLAARGAHFFPPLLLDSQLAALEEPTDVLIVDAAQSVEAIVDQIAEAVSRGKRVS